jgi:hypothetical protein
MVLVETTGLGPKPDDVERIGKGIFKVRAGCRRQGDVLVEHLRAEASTGLGRACDQSACWDVLHPSTIALDDPVERGVGVDRGTEDSPSGEPGSLEILPFRIVGERGTERYW